MSLMTDATPHCKRRSYVRLREQPEIEWRYYDRLSPGVYPAYCVCAKRYRDPGFKRWTCLLRFDVLSKDRVSVIARVPWWINLGSRQEPFASRRSRYFSEWIVANGGPPLRGDRLSPRVFQHRMATVEIGDTVGQAPYSVVRKIVVWETGLVSGHSVSKSRSQDGTQEVQ